MTNCKYIDKRGICRMKGCYASNHKCFGEDMCRCREPITNADHIRSMTDEELANYLLFFCPTTFNHPMYTGVSGEYTEDAEKTIAKNMDWLKQPYKEETT